MVARQFIALVSGENGNRPVGHGMIGYDRRATTGTSNQPGYGSDRALRDGFAIRRVPGNKLPGYDHSVPPGRNWRRPFLRPPLAQYGANICNHALRIDQLLVPIQKLKLTGRIYQIGIS